MLVIKARSVSEALSQGLHAIRVHGIPKPSRVGDVLVMPQPVMTVYETPINRVLFSPMRDANPFFHVMEAIWMLAGRNDLPWLTRYNKKFAAYSDDGGKTQPGAYGYRWRNYFGHDQLKDIILELKQNPDTRRAVLAMWDGGARASWQGDLMHEGVNGDQPGDFFAAVGGSADVPCNTHAYFDTVDGRLNMTVCCRSNDIIWGAYGANAVHFSLLLEFMSAAIGIPMGVYRQFSNNYHLYTNIVPREQLIPMADDARNADLYLVRETPNALNRVPAKPPLRQVPLMQTDLNTFEADLFRFMENDPSQSPDSFTEPFIKYVVIPMAVAHTIYKEKNYDDAITVAETIRAEDWRIACVEWLLRRKIKHEQNKERFTEVAGDPIKPDALNQDTQS